MSDTNPLDIGGESEVRLFTEQENAEHLAKMYGIPAEAIKEAGDTNA